MIWLAASHASHWIISMLHPYTDPWTPVTRQILHQHRFILQDDSSWWWLLSRSLRTGARPRGSRPRGPRARNPAWIVWKIWTVGTALKMNMEAGLENDSGRKSTVWGFHAKSWRHGGNSIIQARLKKCSEWPGPDWGTPAGTCAGFSHLWVSQATKASCCFYNHVRYYMHIIYAAYMWYCIQ
jgi:hypothetical protein